MTLKKIEAMFASPLFLTVAILYSVVTAMSVIISRTFDVVSIILVIALWLAFAAAKDGKLSEKQTGIKMISGCAKAWYIILWVVIGIILACSVLIMAIGPAALDMVEDVVTEYPKYVESEINESADSDNYNDFVYNLNGVFDDVDGEFSYNFSINGDVEDLLHRFENIPAAMSRFFYTVIGMILIVVSVILILINIFFYRNLHKLTKSVCVSFETGNVKLEKLRTVKIWLIVLAVFSGLNTMNSLLFVSIAGVSSGCSCAAMILAVIMLSKLENDDGGEPETSEVSQIPDQL